MSKDPQKLRKNLDAHPLVQSRMRAFQARRPFSLEPAGMIKGVTFVNDSSATDTLRVVDSLNHFEEPVVWITEANDPDLNFDDYAELLRNRVKAVIVYGDVTAPWHEALWDYLGFFVKAESWSECIDLSLEVSRANDTVVFSPGCPASEPFANYHERGAYFNRLLQTKANTKV